MRFFACQAALSTALAAGIAWGQAGGDIASRQDLRSLENPGSETLDKESSLIDEVLNPEIIFRVDPSRSKIVRTRLPVERLAITNSDIVEVNEFSPTEFEIIGQKSGQTTLTLWFKQADGSLTVLRYLVKVEANDTDLLREEAEYGKLQIRINELFPNSQVQLIPVADKLIIRGQARDAEEAAQILGVVGGQSTNQQGGLQVQSVNLGPVARLPGAPDLQTSSVINLLRVPGEQQVMLKVRVAELTRTAKRNMSVDFDIVKDNFALSSILSGGIGNISAILDGGDVALLIQAFSSNGMGKILAEPNLVTISGKPATFLAGGEFAVPTTVGVNGVGAVSTTFRGFGTQLAFTPTVLDKDKIRLQVAPSFSSLNQANAVDGIPGLNTRAVVTTVDLREGQWLAIAGLIQEEQTGSKSRIPYIGDIPLLGAAFSNQATSRSETELIVLVSPELVHPMEYEQVPPLLPGMEVTDPTNKEFFFHQQIEGLPWEHHRSTVFPQIAHQVFHANHDGAHGYVEGHPVEIQQSEDFYITGPHGFSR
ncbi:type II and III secretion system protein family protein [Lignipirellula cremea]|nr:pilus assembly protein N-terminal domain-containing protein [Lignipirellula cremea]